MVTNKLILSKTVTTTYICAYWKNTYEWDFVNMKFISYRTHLNPNSVFKSKRILFCQMPKLSNHLNIFG